MLIRKNTKPFKTIFEIVSSCRDRPDREQLIRLYITKAGDSIQERIGLEGIQGEAAVFYEMNYQAVLGNLKSSSHQLLQSDEVPGIYFFHSSSNKVWDETPFEFDEAIKKVFGALPDLPVFRKKGKTEKFVLPPPKLTTESKPRTKEEGQAKKEKVAKKKSAKVVELWPKQPDYNLKHEIHFTGLERVVVRQVALTKRDVLEYYNKIADYLLPHLKNRPQVFEVMSNGKPTTTNFNLASLAKSSGEEIPDWIQTFTLETGKDRRELLLCNDREHLLFYVQIGCVEFNAGPASIKSLDSPDYIIVEIESRDYELGKAIEVALAAKEILTGLKLPSFVKTDGGSALHIYIPLDSKSDFESSMRAAEYLCKLVRLRVPDLVTIIGSKDDNYTKVSLDFTFNEKSQAVRAPYSLVADSANVATPLLWEEVQEGLTPDAFNYETIFKRLKDEGDPFEALFRKKVNADALLERMKDNYSFLF